MKNSTTAYENLKTRIVQAASKAGRSPAQIRLIGVTKKQPIDKVKAVVQEGLQDLGQNYVQELETQARALTALNISPHWHFIGNLQRNKVKALLHLFPQQPPLIHTVDRLSLAQALEDEAAKVGRTVTCLLQILPESRGPLNTERAGCPRQQAADLLTALVRFKHLRVDGLMILPPADEDPVAHFKNLRKLGTQLQTHIDGLECEHLHMNEYSMGMSDDFEAAIAEGSTMIRIGTKLFGERS